RVRFRTAAGLVLSRHRVLVEVGPGTARPWIAQADPDAVCVRTVRQSYENAGDRQILLEALGELWANGVEADWPRLHRDTADPNPAHPTPAHLTPARRTTLPPRALVRRRYLPDTEPPAGPWPAPSGARQVEPAPETPTPSSPEEAPGSTVAQFLAHRFRVLLGLREVHPDDHFFHLGGDSLMGVHLIAGLKELTGQAVPSSVVFASATLGGMTREVQEWLTTTEYQPEPLDHGSPVA
ncbi:MAG TPA: phosphopantetheine-binding protein, partial [Amycolatopsis sp.]